MAEEQRRHLSPSLFDDWQKRFSTDTIVFGPRLLALMTLLLALLGCSNGAGSGTASRDASGDLGADATKSGDVIDAADVLDETAMADVGAEAAADAGSDVRDAPAPPPPRQWRRACATMPDGDPGIAPPRLIYPMSPMRVTSQRPRLRWELPPGVTGARVDLCRDPCCERPIASFDADGDSGQPPEALPPGVVFWRARGRVGARVGRQVSFTWEMSVRHRSAPVDTAWGTLKDFNGDGFDDVLAVVEYRNDRRFWQALRLYWGSSAGVGPPGFQEIEAVDRVVALHAGDFDGDGFADVIVCNRTWGDDRLRPVVLRGGAGAAVAIPADGAPGTCTRGSVGDFNGDGYSDIAGRLPQALDLDDLRDELYVSFGGPGGLDTRALQEIPRPTPRMPQGLFGALASSPGDVRGDGYADLIVGRIEPWEQTPRELRVFDGRAEGVSVVASAVITADELDFVGGFAYRIAPVGDLNGDHLGDIAVLRDSAEIFDVLLGDFRDGLHRVGQVRMHGVIPAGELPNFAAPVDVTGDGIGDLVYGCSGCVIDSFRSIRGYAEAWARVGSPSRSRVAIWNNDVPEVDMFAGTISCPGDVDGDGFDETVVGAASSTAVVAGPSALWVLWGGTDAIWSRRTTVSAAGGAPGASARLGLLSI